MPPPPIDHDLPCTLCDYNLKGLAPDAHCPECGQPISRTFTYDLTWADPAWLRRQARSLPFLGALFLLNFQSRDFLAAASYLPVIAFVGHALFLIVTLVAAWACFRLAAPDPAFAAEADGTYRRGLQLGAVLLLVASILDLPQFRQFSIIPGGLRLGPATLLRTLLLVATELLALLLVTRLARRSKDPALQRFAARVRYLLPAIYLVQNVGNVIDVRAIAEVYLVLVVLLYWAGPVAAYATLVLLGRLAETLRRAATVAEARDAQPSGAHSPVAPNSPAVTLSPPREGPPGPSIQDAT